MKNANFRKQTGQSMVEYTVILVALTTALIGIGTSSNESHLGSVGLNKKQDGSLLNVVHRRYTEQTYALSISDLVEHPDYGALADYYAQQEKYPQLVPHLKKGDKYLDQVADGVGKAAEAVDRLKDFKPRDLVDQREKEIGKVKDKIKNQLTDIF